MHLTCFLLLTLPTICSSNSLLKQWLEHDCSWIEISSKTNILCTLTSRWCFTGYFMESSVYSRHEYPLVLPFVCLDRHWLMMDAKVNYTRAGGILSWLYDPYLLIYHNCSSDGSTKTIRKKIDKAFIFTKHHINKYFGLEIFNKGTETYLFERDGGYPEFSSEVRDWIFNKGDVVNYTIPNNTYPYTNYPVKGIWISTTQIAPMNVANNETNTQLSAGKSNSTIGENEKSYQEEEGSGTD